MPNFETFTRKHRPAPAGDPTVTITARHQVALNRAAVEAIHSPDAVELLYDRTARIVGIRAATDPEGATAHALRAAGASDGRRFSAKQFLTHFGVTVDQSLRWPAYMADGILCIDLSQPGTPSSSNRLGTGHTPTTDRPGEPR